MKGISEGWTLSRSISGQLGDDTHMLVPREVGKTVKPKGSQESKDRVMWLL